MKLERHKFQRDWNRVGLTSTTPRLSRLGKLRQPLLVDARVRRLWMAHPAAMPGNWCHERTRVRPVGGGLSNPVSGVDGDEPAGL